LLNKGYTIGRTVVYRLMKELNIKGAKRGKIKRTTSENKKYLKTLDLVNRNFNSNKPNKLWVADFTYVYTYNNAYRHMLHLL
jgi:putative transposase